MQVHARSHIGKTLMLRRGHVVRLVAPTERIDDERQRRYGELPQVCRHLPTAALSHAACKSKVPARSPGSTVKVLEDQRVCMLPAIATQQSTSTWQGQQLRSLWPSYDESKRTDTSIQTPSMFEGPKLGPLRAHSRTSQAEGINI